MYMCVKFETTNHPSLAKEEPNAEHRGRQVKAKIQATKGKKAANINLNNPHKRRRRVK